jgi:peptide/nickel transport system substrate-binding protein
MRRLGQGRASVAIGAAAATLMAGAMIGGLAGGAGAAGVAGTRTAAGGPQIASGGVIKYAELPTSSANYIFAETSTANQSLYNNSQFINLMWPLVYRPAPDQPVLDYAHSMAYPPVWNKTDTEVTVTLKNYNWSDGTPVTARDLVFYINLGKAMGATWGNYGGPSQFPYNLKSYTATSAKTIQFVLNSPINPTFFDDNGIDYITPIPQHAWDKESANGPVGNYDMTPAGALKVVTFLQKQAADMTTYTSNPLWKVIDGPWELKSFGGSSSPDVFVPNPDYSGPKPYVSEFEEIPFTTDSAEYTSLKSPGTLNYGYIPTQDFPTIPSIQSEGYDVTKIPLWGFDYIIPNQKNPQVGPILSQIYIRQVLAELTDQNTMIKHFMDGFGIPTYGPTPVYPLGNPFVSKAELKNPYPYSTSAAEALLKHHGWQVNAGKVDVCMVPGPSGCGAGITKGEQLSLNLLYSSGSAILQEDTDLFQSDAAQAGVQINPKSAGFNTVISQVQQCVLPKDKGTPLCNWQLGEYGGISESTYPSGEGLLNSGGAFNAGSYSNPTLDKLIAECTTASTLQTYYQYEDLVVQQEPWIWQPEADNVSATAKNLNGFGMTTEFGGFYGYIEPEFWYFTK